MILVPYFWDTTNPDWSTLGLFLCSGGRAVWSLDDTDTDAEIRAMLAENGFPVARLHRQSGTVHAEIDRSRLKMSHFYQWSEIDYKTSEEDVWRIFKIPCALWSCPVFKEKFWKSAALPFDRCLVPVTPV